uniref:Uncharacterized protein n=1 Tax=Romanomermis culicivorax TaxID=13658 RepID=A0A915KQL7_ROMCU
MFTKSSDFLKPIYRKTKRVIRMPFAVLERHSSLLSRMFSCQLITGQWNRTVTQLELKSLMKPSPCPISASCPITVEKFTTSHEFTAAGKLYSMADRSLCLTIPGWPTEALS